MREGTAEPRGSAERPIAGNSVMALVVAMRPYQWPKNLLVFAALAFSAGEAWTLDDLGGLWELLGRSVVLVACWCLASSGTYLVNDVRDRELDRQHPRKRRRPIASGALGVQVALGAAVVLWAVALPVATVVDALAGAILAGYVVLMVLYSAGLKSVPVLDVLILCAGVVGRAVSGAAGIDVAISPWLYMCASCAAFFFASSKRWSEFRQLGEEAAHHRPSLAGYSGEILNQMVVIGAATALISYALYTIESDYVPSNGAMAVTLPFVVFALFRYLLLLSGKRQKDAPDQILFTDPGIVLAMAGWLVTAMAVLISDRT
ncbi:MAG: UbiA prenyltransferase family protein [Tepidiformaceae bacterium]